MKDGFWEKALSNKTIPDLSIPTKGFERSLTACKFFRISLKSDKMMVRETLVKANKSAKHLMKISASSIICPKIFELLK